MTKISAFHHTDVDRAAATSKVIAEGTATVLLFSDSAERRLAVRRAVGRRASKGTPFINWIEVATADVLFERCAEGGLDLLIADGETAKVGGFSVAREVKDRFFDAPPVLLLIAREQDAWLAAWTGADAVVPFPVAPNALAEAVAAILRSSAA